MSNLTDEQCEEFRRLPGSFNNMVREIYAAGVASMQGEADDTLLAAIEQEPVLQIIREQWPVKVHWDFKLLTDSLQNGQLLYAAPQPNAAIKQEPVAYMMRRKSGAAGECSKSDLGAFPVYATTLPQGEQCPSELTDDAICILALHERVQHRNGSRDSAWEFDERSLLKFARALLAALPKETT